MVMHLRFKGATPGTPNADAAVRYILRVYPAGAEASSEGSYAAFPAGERPIVTAVPPFVSLAHRSYALDDMKGVYEIPDDDDMTAEDAALLDVKCRRLEVRYTPTACVFGLGSCPHKGEQIRRAVARLRQRLEDDKFPEMHFCNEVDDDMAGAGAGAGAESELVGDNDEARLQAMLDRLGV